MKTSLEEFATWLRSPEGPNLEFKEGKVDVANELPDYCAALANEGGGKLILGVREHKTEKRFEVIGTSAFDGTYNRLSSRLLDSLGIRVDVEELLWEGQRVIIFHVPKRQQGQVIRSSGKYRYPMRVGESLAKMDDQTIRRIINEAELDFSAEIVPKLTLFDLDEHALLYFRERWAKETERPDYRSLELSEMLTNLRLIKGKGITYAALILLGTEQALADHLPDAEVIFEWRQIPGKTSHDLRKTWTKPAILALEEIWECVNEKNFRFPFQEGLFQYDIWAFNEKPIREAILNAIAHRDYHLKGRSIFITASPKEFCIESPGGFPYGITVENILDEHMWRNRLLADVLNRVGLVERSGQGLNDIFEATVRSGKGLPAIEDIDGYKVNLFIPAQVQDIAFVAYLEKVLNQKQVLLSLKEILTLEEIRSEETVSRPEYKEKLLKLGLIEQVGRTRGAKYVLSHNYYAEGSKRGHYTRLVGFTREEKKALILKHLEKNKEAQLSEFSQAFPEMKQQDISNLLQELKRSGEVFYTGSRKVGRWYKSEEK